tara:strand:- start:483 stop:722 length:240 start_codon:yes stop_codon:yes gene_type:complete
MATAKSKKEEVVDLGPVLKEVEALKKELVSVKKEISELKKAPKSSGSSSELAKDLISALKELTGPNTKGVRNFIREKFK